MNLFNNMFYNIQSIHYTDIFSGVVAKNGFIGQFMQASFVMNFKFNIPTMSVETLYNLIGLNPNFNNLYYYNLGLKEIPINNFTYLNKNIILGDISYLNLGIVKSHLIGNHLSFYTHIIHNYNLFNLYHYFVIFTLVIFYKNFNFLISKYTINNISSNILFFIILFALLTPTSSYNNISQNNIYILLCILCNFFYILFGTIYDLMMWKYKFQNNIIKNKFLNKLILGILYFINIFLAVWATNGSWFLTKDVIDRPLGIIITTIGTFIGSGLWLILATPPAQARFISINSLFRSLAECSTFNSISWLTYAAWDYYIIYNHHILLGTILFTVLHFLFSGIVIYLETLGTGFIYYAIAYICSFFCGVFSTNSFFELYLNNYNNLITIIIILLSGLFVIILHPDIYRSSISLNDMTVRYIISRILTYYILFINFVFTTGLLFNYI